MSTFLQSKTVTLVAAAVVVPGTLAVALVGAFGSNAESAVSISQSVPVYKQRVRVWIHGDGIRPQIVHAKPGLVNLTLENKTILNAEIMIERLLPNQAVTPIGTITISPERARGNQELLLDEGEYVLYERGRPRFKAKLVVSP